MTFHSEQNLTPGDQPRKWKHGEIPVIGLIGGVGAGKSWVAAEFGRRGATVVDADSLAHELLRNPLVSSEVIRTFGSRVLASDGMVDRKTLGAVVFEDAAARKRLESILHPRIREFAEQSIACAISEGRPVVVLDAALLLESGWDELCDAIVFVDAPISVRRARVAEHRSWPSSEHVRREHAQAPLEAKSSRWVCRRQRRRLRSFPSNRSSLGAIDQASLAVALVVRARLTRRRLIHLGPFSIYQ